MRRHQFAGLLFLVLLVPALMLAQQDRGTFTGTVTDPTGAVIPGVEVTIQNMATNATYQTRTNEVGQYTFPNLPIGTYRLSFEVDGFKTVTREGLQLNIAQVARVDVTMELGLTTEQISVEAETPLLQTETPDVGTTLENQRVIDLPLSFSSGRYAEDFAYKLTPGVEGNNWTSRINGSPAFSKEVVLDGASVTTYITGHFGENSPSMEAVEEFKVQTSGMSAEFGRTAGGVFNFVLRSGTNDWHGSAMGQLRNEWMNANSFSNNAFGRPRDRDRRHNFAFSGGGPVKIPGVYDGRDKSFFYVAYERFSTQNLRFGAPNSTVPLPEWYEGDLSRLLTSEVLDTDALGRPVLRGQVFDPASTRTVGGEVVRDPFPDNRIPQSRISRVSRNLSQVMQEHYLPEVRGEDGQFALINNAFFPANNTAEFTQDQFSVKGDHYISDRHKLAGSVLWVNRPRILLDQGGVWDRSDPEGGPLSRARLQRVNSYYGRLAYDWTAKPTVLNHLVLAVNRQNNPSTSQHIDEPGGEILGIAGIDQSFNYPQINLEGGDQVEFPTLGYQQWDVLHGTSTQIANTVSWLSGRHSFKFGVDWRRNFLTEELRAGPGEFTFTSDLTGQIGFNQTGHPFASMLLGQVQSANIPTLTPTGSEFNYLSFFIQDDFKVNRRLTLNMGLRWEYQPQQTEQYDRLHNFNPHLTDPLTGLPGAVEFAGTGDGRTGSRRFFDNQKNDFGPRFGLAYQISDKFVFRGGYGIFYSSRVPQDWSGVPYGQKFGFTKVNRVNNPGNNQAAFQWDDGYPGVPTDASTINPSLALTEWGPVHWDPNGGKVAYTQQWNANFQYELPAQLILDLGYVGTKTTGIQANQLKQINQLRPEVLVLGDMLTNVWVNNQADIPAEAQALGAIYPFENVPQAERPFGGWVPIQQTLQPFPQVPFWSTLLGFNVPLGFNNYNAFQLSINKRYSRGLSLIANYTFSKSFDNVDSAFQTWVNGGRPIDYYNLGLEKTISPFDQTHVVKIGATYELPFGRGKKFGSSSSGAANAIIGGWTINYIGNYRSGVPLGLAGTSTAGFNAATNRAVLENPNGQPLTVDFDSSRFDMSQITTPGLEAHKIINTSIVRNPNRFERGNAPFRSADLRAFPTYQEDISFQKNFAFKERMRLQFRLDMFNVFNRHRFEQINTNPASPLFGQVTGLDDGFFRQTQVGVRLDF